MDMFMYFELAIGVYLLYCAITGKGKYYDNDYCKVPREQYVRVMRILAWIEGVVVMIAPILTLTGVIETISVWNSILWFVNMAIIVGMFIANIKMTDRTKAKAAQNRPAPKKADSLRAAFVFDDDAASEAPEASKPEENKPEGE